jgi:hypothetical protein
VKNRNEYAHQDFQRFCGEISDTACLVAHSRASRRTDKKKCCSFSEHVWRGSIKVDMMEKTLSRRIIIVKPLKPALGVASNWRRPRSFGFDAVHRHNCHTLALRALAESRSLTNECRASLSMKNIVD